MPLKDYLKRIWTWQAHREKIIASLNSRKGQCKQCGKCCNFFGMKCPFLSKDNRCKIYRFRPKLLCKIPPLNTEKGNYEKHKCLNCRYYWENHNENHKKGL